jgi:hypothetical protein
MKITPLSYSIALLFSGISTVASADFGTPFYLPYVSPSQSDFGGVGLLQTPSARMAPPGEFSLNYRDNDQYRFWTLSLQLVPWLETTIRYTDVRTRQYGDTNFSGEQTYKDKAIDLKARLWQETRWTPDMSLGFRDIGGTGLFDSEYLVASKAVGPFDFTAGMGWGYLASSGNIVNPFCRASNGYCRRSESYSGRGGSIDADRFFHGPAAVFGGVEYQTPWQPLRIKAEYDANDYRNDRAGRLKQDAPVNVGVLYSLNDWSNFSVDYERGNTLTFGITLNTNFDTMRSQAYKPPKPDYRPSKQPANFDPHVAATQLTALRDNAGFASPRINRVGDTVYVAGEQTNYRDLTEGVDRANRIIMNALPAGARQIVITEERENVPMASYRSDSLSLAKVMRGLPPGVPMPENVDKVEEPKQPASVQVGYALEKSPWQFNWSPVLNQSVGGPESFYMYQIALSGSASYQISDNWKVGGVTLFNLNNNYDKFNYTAPPADSNIPQVRTHIRSYVTSSDVYLNNFQMTYTRAPGNGWYMQSYGGYLEMMFAGVGSEVLYRPLKKHWAIGADINHVKQRDWDDPVKMADYSVTTGHVTGYWQPSFADEFLVKVSLGRYLAGDKGSTVDISRRFASGITAGAYATLTNVSSRDYGEGSFTKGFYISIPLDLLSTHPTNTRARFNWEPLTRDGGQPLQKRYSLYDLTQARGLY